MTSKKEPAFPSASRHYVEELGEHCNVVHSGITKREYFAAKAMQAYITLNTDCSFNEIAVDAYDMADAMLDEGKE